MMSDERESAESLMATLHAAEMQVVQLEIEREQIRVRYATAKAGLGAARAAIFEELEDREGPVVEACEDSFDSMLGRAVRQAGRRRSPPAERWVHVMNAFCVGSTAGAELCRRYGLDPNETIGVEAERTCCEGCDCDCETEDPCGACEPTS